MIILKYENLKKNFFFKLKFIIIEFINLIIIFIIINISADDRIELSIQDHESYVLTITLIHREI